MLSQAEFEGVVAKAKVDPAIEQNEQEVWAKYGPMFTPAGIAALEPEKFRAFLTYKENRHWTGINRHSGDLTADLPLLKKALTLLVDQSKPIAGRIDEARRMMSGRGLGKAVISAILIVAHPDKCGVYNNKSVEGLKKLGKYPGGGNPDFEALSTGKRYEQVNGVLSELSAKYGIKLWALDWVLGTLGTGGESELAPSTPGGPAQGEEAISSEAPVARFRWEEQLEDYLVENWDTTSLASSLDILTDDEGDISGQQYRTEVGPIDILCKNKDGSGYTVVELKRGQTGDDTVGQVARYMGWVKKKLAKNGQMVRGLIICRDADEKLMTALEVVPNVDVFTYEVRFTLSKKD